MASFASQMPLIYCLMYFQSNRRFSRNQSNILLEALTPHRRWSRSSRSYLGDSREHFGDGKQLPSSLHDDKAINLLEGRTWKWHRDADSRQLCLERYFNSSQMRSNKRRNDIRSQKNNTCSSEEPRDHGVVNPVMTGRFMTVQELQTLIHQVSIPHNNRSYKPTRRFQAEGSAFADLVDLSDSYCNVCGTKIGYEVVTHVTDLQGVNHTVINFEDSYQFIPAGRCVNENSRCGGGGNARCIQIYRAKWTLVWTASSGTQLVAHEVPSHCQCINVGTPLDITSSPLVKKLKTVASSERNTTAFMSRTDTN